MERWSARRGPGERGGSGTEKVKEKDLERDLVKSEKRIPPRIQGDLLAYPPGNVLWEKIQRLATIFQLVP